MTTTTITAPLSSPFPRAARYVATGARCTLGLVFFAAGLTGLLNLLPPPSLALLAAELYLAWVYRSAYQALFVRRATPAV